MKFPQKLFPRREDAVRREDYWPSVVVLLKEPLLLSPEDAVRIGQASWGAHAPVELVGTPNNGLSFLLRCGEFFFSVNHASQRYEVQGEEPSESLQRPWDEHTAWLSIDIPNKKTEDLRKEKALASCYKLLLVFSFRIWSENCLGVYFPCEGVTIPSLGDLATSVRWARQHGTNLDFLDDSQ